MKSHSVSHCYLLGNKKKIIWHNKKNYRPLAFVFSKKCLRNRQSIFYGLIPYFRGATVRYASLWNAMTALTMERHDCLNMSRTFMCCGFIKRGCSLCNICCSIVIIWCHFVNIWWQFVNIWWQFAIIRRLSIIIHCFIILTWWSNVIIQWSLLIIWWLFAILLLIFFILCCSNVIVRCLFAIIWCRLNYIWCWHIILWCANFNIRFLHYTIVGLDWFRLFRLWDVTYCCTKHTPVYQSIRKVTSPSCSLTTDSFRMAYQLENLLAEIGLHGLYNNFRTQRVEINNLSDLTDNELSRLGVTTIGDRVRLREKARERLVLTFITLTCFRNTSVLTVR